jgi:hypothetical protein
MMLQNNKNLNFFVREFEDKIYDWLKNVWKKISVIVQRRY